MDLNQNPDTPNQKTVYQFDLAGRYLGETVADESPREPGIYLLPARTTETAPPPRDTWPDGSWPRWIGTGWTMTGLNKPRMPADDPLTVLQKFLIANPAVVALIGLDAPEG